MNNKEQLMKNLIDKIVSEVINKVETKDQNIEELISKKFDSYITMQNRPTHYDVDFPNYEREYSYQEEIEGKNFEEFIRTGNANLVSRKSLQAISLTSEDGKTDTTRGTDLIPTILEKSIFKKMGEKNIFRKLSTIRKVSGNLTEVLQVLDKIGDLGWVGEIEDRNLTDTPTIRKIAIKLFEMYAQPKASQILIHDARINIINWLKEEIADAFAKTELNACLRGDGIDRPMGVLNPIAKVITVQTKTAKTVEFQDLLNLYNSLDAQYREGSCFIMSPKMQGTIYGLKDLCGNCVVQNSFKEAFPSSLFGMPIYLCGAMDDGSNTGDMPIIFGNFKSAYLIIDCNPMRFIRDDVTEKQWVKLYMTKRVGAHVMNSEALKILEIK